MLNRKNKQTRIQNIIGNIKGIQTESNNYFHNLMKKQKSSVK